MSSTTGMSQLPCSLTIDIPFPDARLVSVALRAISVDKELSPLVRRELSTVTSEGKSGVEAPVGETILRARYCATTNRMLRVAVNSFMDSLALVLEVMEELDIDVLQTRSETRAT
ncbi:hypothetical protein VTK73DRAFT_3279 [Phialemonium thermophilum]|uniref:Transcription factor Pcc1 n=1 Tax=Phialemonium thermophilum TaxID=223376 RepID=A0ABR3Y8J5_9PEZI